MAFWECCCCTPSAGDDPRVQRTAATGLMLMGGCCDNAADVKALVDKLGDAGWGGLAGLACKACISELDDSAPYLAGRVMPAPVLKWAVKEKAAVIAGALASHSNTASIMQDAAAGCACILAGLSPLLADDLALSPE